jgi:YidC/Oxa1 family membrane protein insertase
MWTYYISIFTNILLVIYAYVGNFALAIVLFTIVIRLATHPMMAAQIKSTAAMTAMTQSEEYLKMQKKYKDDKEKLQQEQLRMYQEKGINPLGGCLPTLIQFPIIIGLYQSITQALGTSPLQLLQLMRSMSIFPWMSSVFPAVKLSELIPLHSQFLWMNLGQPEMIPLPFITETFGFGLPLLAIIVGITTYIQSKLTMPPPAANPGDQSAQMTQMMGIYMPIMLFWFALTFSSGLSVYFITSNLIGILQYALLGKVNWRNLFGGKKK